MFERIAGLSALQELSCNWVQLQVEAAVGEQPYAHMPLDALAMRKMQCAAPILSVAVKGHHFSEVRLIGCELVTPCSGQGDSDEVCAVNLEWHGDW